MNGQYNTLMRQVPNRQDCGRTTSQRRFFSYRRDGVKDFALLEINDSLRESVKQACGTIAP